MKIMQDSFVTCRTVIRLVEVRGTVRKWRGPVKSGEFFICIVSVRYRGWFEVKTSFFSSPQEFAGIRRRKKRREEGKKKRNKIIETEEQKAKSFAKERNVFNCTPSSISVPRKGRVYAASLLLLISHSLDPFVRFLFVRSSPPFPPLWGVTFKNEQRKTVYTR